ncbi:MAG TPA: rRNA maturation RNase YbeY [Vicinamibacterales bacterium]
MAAGRGSRRRLAVSVADAAGRRLRVPGLAGWLMRAAPRSARGSVTLALVGDRRVRALNRRYRGVDRVTDVLSFTADAPAGEVGAVGPFLGDVVIATGVAARQAHAAGHSVGTEYRILALHGLLHLLGYDHERDGGRMARVEASLRRRGGLGHGLIERARAK